MEALRAIDGFGAEHVAAAVICPDGSVAVRGDSSWLFELASVTKLFSAYALLVAIEEESIFFETAVGPIGSTVAHLLAHASGLSFSDQNAVLALPGTKRIYSNVGFEILAQSLEEHTEMEFSAYVTAGVFAPLSMMTAKLLGSPATGGMARIDDLINFASELLRPDLISSETLTKATTTTFPGLDGVLPGFGLQRPCDWGLGFEIKDAKSPHWTGTNNSSQTFGHFGQSGAFVWVDPLIQVALIGLSDRSFGPWAASAWPVLSDAVLAELA